MRHSIAAITALMLGGMALTAGFDRVALADSMVLKPQGGWAVTRIEATEDNGTGAYCTLARQYDDGTILTLGRNATEEYSLAIDFQKPMLDPDRAHKMTLQPGPGQIRAYEMMPASPTAMVIRLGWDESFFDALEQSQTLKIEIEESDYSFNLPEISRGQEDLKSCMEGLKSGDSKQASAEAAQKGDILNAEPGTAKQGFAARKSPATPIEEPRTASAAPIEIAPQDIEPAAGDEAAADAGDDEIIVQMVDEDSAPAAEEGKAPRPPFERPARVSKPVQLTEVDEVVAVPPAEEAAPTPEPKKVEKIAAAPKEPAPAKTDDGTAQKLQQEIAALKADNERLRAALEDSQAASSAEQGEIAEKLTKQEERIRLLETENSKLLGDVRDARSQIDNAVIQAGDQAMRKARDLQKKLDAAQADNQRLAVKMEEMTRMQEESMLSNAEGNWDLEQATQRFNEADREIRRLGMQLDQERMACRQEKAELEGMLFDPAVADQAQIKRMMQMEKELKEAQAKAQDQEKIIDEKLEARVQERTKDLHAKVATMQTQQKGMEQKIAALQEDLKQKETALSQKESELAGKQMELTKTKAEVTQQSAELTQKEAALRKAEEEPKIDPKLQAEVARLKTETTALKAQLAAKPDVDPGVVTELAAVKAERDSLANLNNVLKADVDKLKLQIGDIQSRSANATDRTASLQLEVKDLKEQLARKENEARTFQNQLTVMKDESAQLKMRLTNAEANQQDAAEAASLRDEVRNLQAQVRQMEGGYKDRIAALERDRDGLERALNSRTAPAAGAQTYSSAAATPSRPAPSPAPAAQPRQASASAGGLSQGEVQSVLQQAGIQASVSGNASSGYQWRSGALSGSAQARSIGSASAFPGYVQGAISAAKSRCNGDFASIPSKEGPRFASYEIACVGGSGSTSSSILFYEKNGQAITIGHETAPENMDAAMDARDKVAKAVLR